MPVPQFIKLKVHPNSKKDEIVRKTVDSFEIWVRAPAERGLANIAALLLLGKSLTVGPKKLRIVKGSRTPAKIIKVC
ncbi:MAG: DUF167 family protein [bacterium]